MPLFSHTLKHVGPVAHAISLPHMARQLRQAFALKVSLHWPHHEKTCLQGKFACSKFRYHMILSNKRITKTLIRLCRCAGWSASLLFANTKDRFSNVEGHIILRQPVNKVCLIHGCSNVNKYFVSKICSRVGISGTTAKLCQREFVPSSHPGPFAVVATSRKTKHR